MSMTQHCEPLLREHEAIIDLYKSSNLSDNTNKHDSGLGIKG